jgi:hypothetical protein
MIIYDGEEMHDIEDTTSSHIVYLLKKKRCIFKMKKALINIRRRKE